MNGGKREDEREREREVFPRAKLRSCEKEERGAALDIDDISPISEQLRDLDLRRGTNRSDPPRARVACTNLDYTRERSQPVRD